MPCHRPRARDHWPDLFGWLPAGPIARAIKAERRLGVFAVQVEGREGELILRLASGASVRLIIGGDDPWKDPDDS